MKFLKTLIAAAGLVFAAACSDTSNQMTGIDPSFAKVGKGGYGDPHFSTDKTVCTFNDLTGQFACDYQIAGLSAYSAGYVLLTGVLVVDYSCVYSNGTEQEKSTFGFEFADTTYADKSGVAKGHVEASAEYIRLLRPRCSKMISGVLETPDPSDFSYELTVWLLSAVVSTPKGGGLQPIVYNGSWVPAVIE